MSQAESLVRLFKANIVQSNLEVYRKLFKETSRSDATDKYWQIALEFFHELSPNQREVLFKIIKQTQIDTLAHILGIIDGTVLTEGETDLSLMTNNERVSGDLQDLFLSLFEEQSS